jgi:hypothetical protein
MGVRFWPGLPVPAPACFTLAGGRLWRFCAALPPIDNETLMVLLTGMLGLGGLRTFERIKGKA